LHQEASASGEYPVILFAVFVAATYVVTPDRDYSADDSHPDYGFSNFYSSNSKKSIALLAEYNAHFIPVRKCSYTHCVTGKSIARNTGFQAAVASNASESLHRALVSLRQIRL
jgi:hypothetical protein